MHVRVLLSRYRAYITCPSCKGGRYQPEALNYKISTKSEMRNPESEIVLSIPEFQGLPISDARDFLRNIEIPASNKTAQMLRDEICARLNFLCDVGVCVLTLDRSSRSLCGGVVHR